MKVSTDKKFKGDSELFCSDGNWGPPKWLSKKKALEALVALKFQSQRL